MKKKIIFAIIFVAIIFSVIITTHNSLFKAVAESSVSGNLGDNLTWTLENETLTISGQGEMIHNPTVWSDYSTGIKKIVIENGVTTIGHRAFKSFDNLVEVSLPNTISTIGISSFEGCASLESIIIPDSVIEYGASNGRSGAVFKDCTNLEKVTLSQNATMIAASMFKNCSSLSHIVIPQEVTTIYNYAFFGCSALLSVDFPASLVNVYSNAFQNCISLKDIVIPNGVTTFGDEVFKGCTSLTSVVLPGTLNTIEDNVFYNCVSLADIVFSEGMTSIGYYMFCNCDSITTITLPGSMRTISEGAFYGCDNLTTVDFGTGVQTIGKNAFYSCISIGVLEISDSVTTVESMAFSNCSNIKIIVLGESVTSISSNTFTSCSSITEVTVKCESLTIGFGSGSDPVQTLNLGPKVTGSVKCIGENLKEIIVDEGNETYCSVDGVLFSKDMTVLYRYPAAKEGTSYNVPDSVRTISDYAFLDADISNLIIGNGVTHIGSNAFVGSAICEVRFTGSRFTTGYNIFNEITATCYYPSDNETWTSDVLSQYGGTLTWLSSDADEFKWSVSVDNVLTITGQCDMPIWSSYESVPWHSYADSIVSIVIEKGIKGISQYAFYGFENVKNVDIPSTVTYIGDYAFSHCSMLTDVVIPDGVTSIMPGSFEYCTNLNNILLPGTVSIIGDIAFRYCTSLESIVLPDGITSLAAVFAGCSGLKNVTLPNTISKLTLTFQNCTSLESIVLPSSLTYLDQQVFDGCTALKTVIFTGNAPDLYYLSAGYGYTQFENVTADCYYPITDSTWNNFPKINYGENSHLTWIGYTPEEGSGGGSGDNSGTEEGDDSNDAGGTGSGTGDGDSESGKENENTGSGGSNSGNNDSDGSTDSGSGSGNEGDGGTSGNGLTVVSIGVGSDSYSLSENTLIIKHDKACKVGFMENETYKAIEATANSDGSYSFRIPEGTEEILIVIKGDSNADGRYTAADVARINAHMLQKIELTNEEFFAGDVNCDSDITQDDINIIMNAILRKSDIIW